MTSPIDWRAAAARAASVVPAGPPVDRTGAAALVASLRRAAAQAPPLVAGVTGLHEASAAAGDRPPLVVDRARWAAAATETFASLTDGVLPPPRLPGAARVAGEQLGVVLALLGTRVLGQFDPYAQGRPDGTGAGRLLLVAPNILTVQRQLDADPTDFHLWVCLHEQTHAVQFAAAPWLADHLRAALARVMEPVDGDADGEDAPAPVARPARRAVRGRAGAVSAVPGVLESVLEPPQREALADAVAVMSLLEGHADVVMDEVGPTAIPSVARIRAGFEKRRDERTWASVLVRRLLGMDAKLAQYRTGAAFVRGVLGAVGHEGLNAVWAGPERLPTADEIADPAAWVARVHG
ncbi:zinc-dependent metalloprotease [Litorihabitans aurantiacus]|uniref:Hydrolase n=1 Tax=Litorihabitans aurantiacus TaxID=1930061 RepID=A0AA38CQR2_9MICO|nr:zinc-dependent metalloprotease [Litorihabitans aurantiacus]GMA32453.1 hypothetical protein GCM10025875_24450 [Litorihabitans aurantiacus]